MGVKKAKVWLAVAGIVLLGAGVLAFGGSESNDKDKGADKGVGRAGESRVDPDTVTITRDQAKAVKVVSVDQKGFEARKDAVGYIDFDEDRNVQVFAQYPGHVRQIFVKAGDDVRKGQALFSIDSPDLVQAESNLISTAGILALTDRALERAHRMFEVQANAQKDVDQATSDQQTAESNHKAARDAVRIFEKTEAEIDRIVETKKVDGELIVKSPIAGRVTARSVQPGLLVQPGNQPAPLVVSDISQMWLIANVPEVDIPTMHVGQAVVASMMAYPGQAFQGNVSYIGESVDPATHRIIVRSQIRDPRHALRPQMMATFVIRTGTSTTSAAVPAGGVVREGDGSMSVFVTEDGLTFKRRSVKLGVEREGSVQILDGVAPGTRIAGDGALFLDNALALQAQ